MATPNEFKDATLVILGHGTTLNENSAAPVYQHAVELRRHGIFGGVREAFWKQEPQIKTVLEEIRTPRVFIVPLFMSEGYFAEEAIPRGLGVGPDRTVRMGDRQVEYCKPVGTHPSMSKVVLERARGVMENFPFPRWPNARETTLFIAGHGTERSEKSRQSVERQVELVGSLNIFAAVHAIFLDEDPRIETCYGTAGTRNIVIVPFFASDGLHVAEDIPVLLGEPERIVKERVAQGMASWRNPTERHGKLVWYAPSVGTEPHLAGVILERVKERIKTG